MKRRKNIYEQLHKLNPTKEKAKVTIPPPPPPSYFAGQIDRRKALLRPSFDDPIYLDLLFPTERDWRRKYKEGKADLLDDLPEPPLSQERKIQIELQLAQRLRDGTQKVWDKENRDDYLKDFRQTCWVKICKLLKENGDRLASGELVDIAIKRTLAEMKPKQTVINGKRTYIQEQPVDDEALEENMSNGNVVGHHDQSERQKTLSKIISIKENPALSTGERQILTYLLYGYSEGEIAKRMHCSKITIHRHLKRIWEKVQECQ